MAQDDSTKIFVRKGLPQSQTDATELSVQEDELPTLVNRPSHQQQQQQQQQQQPQLFDIAQHDSDDDEADFFPGEVNEQELQPQSSQLDLDGAVFRGPSGPLHDADHSLMPEEPPTTCGVAVASASQASSASVVEAPC